MKKSVSTLATSAKDPVYRSLFSLDYIKDMIKVFNKKDQITLNIGKDLPFKLIRENEYQSIVYLLAPRIKTD